MTNLSAVEQKFILHWGEMGARWGINRTVAQVHALLFLSPKPLPAETIQETLGVARSNVSTSLKELQGWRIVKLVHLPGDRRDHFESMADVWEMFRAVAEERKRRELDPTLAVLRECIEEAHKDKATGEHSEQRLRELHAFFATAHECYEQTRDWPTPVLVKAAKMAGKLRRLLGLVG
jgi:DNA-binding transcriptional regulator GbsR (MarR family)